MNDEYLRIIRAHSQPLAPRPTDVETRLQKLSDIRSVVFDIYGTLLISASGDVGTIIGTSNESAFEHAIQEVGLAPTKSASSLEMSVGRLGFEHLQSHIRRQHEQGHADGIQYPEVDIVEVWKSTIVDLIAQERLEKADRSIDFRQLAIEYEMRTNPVWTMPGMESCLDSLTEQNKTLGIVSNAQFITPLLFPALTRRGLSDFGFHHRLQFFSFEHKQSKPGRWLYERARESIESLSIEADEVLYVGNDLLNDITPASQVGFRTALFAGDQRSLRLREGDSRVEGIRPDLVVNRLDQILECV